MAVVKTAISIQEDLYERADNMAQQLNMTRSRLMALALEDYVRRWENQRLLEEINAAYEDGADEEEDLIARSMWGLHKSTLEDEWTSTKATSSGSK
jgi:metal-responsive CopG/Arc/MetJ family transcriptional regulator